MDTGLTWVIAGVALLVAALAYLGWRTPIFEILRFYFRLITAQHQANRFYAQFPWVTKNIAYHPNLPGRLDVYQPESGSGHPVVIYVYGGSWRNGNKELYAPAAQRLLPSGFVLVIPDYTLFPQAVYPRPTEEIAAAIAWTFNHIHEYGGDPRRVVLVAQSAGAQIAGLALLETRWLAAHSHRAANLRGFVGISGVYDFNAVLDFHSANPRARQLLSDVLGDQTTADRASPISFVTSAAPPALLIHGDADTTVPISVGFAFHHRLQAAGIPSEFITYPGAGHSDILFRALTEQPPHLLDDIVRFVRDCTTLPADAGPTLDPGPETTPL